MFRRYRYVVDIQRSVSRKYSTAYSPDKRWPGWEVVIGLEVHAQIKSRTKLFSHAWTSTYDEEPNSHVNAFDAAFPGTLPKLNSSCVDLAVRTAIALDAKVQTRSSFDRKHYFYSDLPAGYQITQHYAPLATGGRVILPSNGSTVRLAQIQLEQDTAKTTFDADARLSSVDLNRAGTGLMEIVSEPDMRSPEQAGEYLRTLQAILRSVGSSDGNMEQGSLRCDVNVSVNRVGEPLGTRCEIKNLNSVRFMMIAITAEALRHISLLEQGIPVKQDTRGFDEHKAETFALRSKEDAPDYRYMPDPNLPPLVIDKTYIASVRNSMPELPNETRARLLSRGLNARDVDFIMTLDTSRDIGFDGQLGEGIVSYFDKVAEGRDVKSVFNWISHDLYNTLVSRNMSFRENPVSVVQLRDLIDLVESNKLTGTSGKQLLKHMVDNPNAKSPKDLARELSLLALDDNNDLIDNLCQSAIDALPEEAEVIRKGNTRVLNKLVGQVMRSSKGRANAQVIQNRLREMLLGKETPQ